MSGKFLEAKLVIGGQDATGPAFKEIESKINKLASTANSVSRVSSAISGIGMKVNEAALGVDNLARSFGTISMEVARAERQVGSFGKALHGLGGIAKSVGGIVAMSLGFKALTDLDKGIKASANYAGELAHLKYALQLKPNELAFAEKAAVELPAKYTNQSSADILKSYGELRAAVTHPSEVPQLFEPAIAWKSALETEGKEVSPEDFRASVKALEIAGYSDSPERFNAFSSQGLVKGRQVEGSLMTPENVLEFMRNAGSAARAFSPRFIRDVMPSLIGEQGGQKSGAAMNQIYKTNLGTGLAHAPDAVAQLLALGLIHKGDVAYNKQGNPSGLKPGHQLKDAALAINDPDLWMESARRAGIGEHEGFSSGEGASVATSPGGATPGLSAPGGFLPPSPGMHPYLVHTDLRLQEIMAAAAKHLPAGYTTGVTSGYGAKHGTPGSMHRHGKAMDVQIFLTLTARLFATEGRIRRACTNCCTAMRKARAGRVILG